MGCEFSDRIRKFKKGMITELFLQLSDQSKESFKRMYEGVDKIPEDDLYGVYYQCKRTIKSESAKKGTIKGG